MKIKDNIPNLITLLNLISGGIAVIVALSGELMCASWFIILAAAFDFIDGMSARLLHAKSDIGAQLDSLADVVSFGIAPSIILYALFLKSDIPDLMAGKLQVFPFIALLIAAGSAWRLAKFNIDPGQVVEFRGLPTPATGLFVASLPLILHQYRESEGIVAFIGNFYTLLAIVLVLSWLMISRIPMISLKFKNLKWNDNKPRFILVISVPVLFIIFKFSAIPMIIFLYIIISVVTISLNPKTH